jgi:hypothetical protein
MHSSWKSRGGVLVFFGKFFWGRYLGLWEKQGGSCFIAFLCGRFSKIFIGGTWGAPPLSPPPCVHLWVPQITKNKLSHWESRKIDESASSTSTSNGLHVAMKVRVHWCSIRNVYTKLGLLVLVVKMLVFKLSRLSRLKLLVF